MTRQEPLDYLGRIIKVDDLVVFIVNSYRDFGVGKVVKIADCKVTIKYVQTPSGEIKYLEGKADSVTYRFFNQVIRIM